MKRYVIERNIPGVGTGAVDLTQAAKTSNAAIEKVGGVVWELSYVTGDKTFCIYLADDEAAIMRHSEESGFPANRITEVTEIISPETAKGVSFGAPTVAAHS